MASPPSITWTLSLNGVIFVSKTSGTTAIVENQINIPQNVSKYSTLLLRISKHESKRSTNQSFSKMSSLSHWCMFEDLAKDNFSNTSCRPENNPSKIRNPSQVNTHQLIGYDNNWTYLQQIDILNVKDNRKKKVPWSICRCPHYSHFPGH